MVVTASAAEPAATWCQKDSQAWYGAAAACHADRLVTATAASQTATMGAQASAARYSRRGGQPPRQASVTASAAISETGAAATTSAAAPAIRASLAAARSPASSTIRPRYRRITWLPPRHGPA